MASEEKKRGDRGQSELSATTSSVDSAGSGFRPRKSTFQFSRKEQLPESALGKIQSRREQKKQLQPGESLDMDGNDDAVSACFGTLQRPHTNTTTGKKKILVHEDISEESDELTDTVCVSGMEKKPEKVSKRSIFMDAASVDSVEREEIALSLLGTLSHPSAATSSSSYILYLKTVLGMQRGKMEALCQQAAKEEKTELQLSCCVKSATHLKPKDGKSLPDIICHLAVVPIEWQMDVSLCQQNILDWKQKEKLSEVKMTGFAPATLSPEWNEAFELSLNTPSKEMLVVEIWGRRNKEPKPSSSKKPKEYFKKQDNFIGRAFYVLKTIPLEGEERTLTIFSHSGKHERGRVTLQLAVKGMREDVPVNVSIREHTILFKLIVNHESKEDGKHLSSWECQLSGEAQTFLSKHLELTGITTVQETCIHLSVLLEYHEFQPVKLAVIEQLLEDIAKEKKTVEKNTDQLWVKQLLFDMQSLHSQMLDLVRDHLVKFNIKKTKDVDELTSCLKILKYLYSFPSLVNKLQKTDRNLKTTVDICIQVAVPGWFLELSKSMLADRSGLISPTDGEMELLALKSLCSHCLRQAQRAHEILSPIFSVIDVDYFSEFYVTLDKLLCGEAIPRIGHFSNKQKEPIVYELYVVFKNLGKLSEHVEESRRNGLDVLNFHTYFRGLPVVWIDLAASKCKQRIEKAISLDERMDLGAGQAGYSSSAVDTEGFLLQLGLFWKNLEWPIATDAIGFLCTIIEQISQLSLFYVDALYKALLMDSAIMYDENGRFQSSERLCIILNNMHHVKKTLREMPSTLELESYYVWLQDQIQPLGDQAKRLVSSLLSSHDEDIDTKISYFVDRITERLAPDISEYFEVIVPSTASRTSLQHKHLPNIFKPSSLDGSVKLPWQNKEAGDESLTHEEAITPLLNYLTANLQILADHLLTPVLNAILNKLWNVMIGVVQGRMIAIARHNSKIFLFERLEYIMREMKGFFHADGSGMSLPNLETETFRFIVSKLNLLQMSGPDLVEQFLWDLSEQQKYLDLDENTIVNEGELQLSVGFLIDKSKVEVSIIQARNLKGTDIMNTFVEVHLLPNWLFPKSAKKQNRTHVSKGRNPFYGSEFNLQANESQLLNAGTIVLMFVCECDSDRVLGLCTIHGMHIPHLYAHVNTLEQGDVPERKNLTLKLFKQKETQTLKEIMIRLEANDQDISQFVKSNKRLFDFERIRRNSNIRMWS